MTSIVRRLPVKAAIVLIATGTAVLLFWVFWLSQRASTNDEADRRQATEIASNQNRLDDVSGLARELKDGLTRANRRLKANGVEPVPVPTAVVEGQAGADGVNGIPGSDGESGQDGSDGTNGLPGSPGPSGQPGSTGLTGQVGPQGPKGDAGATGPQGAPGKDGADGTDGVNGQDGAPGQPGQPGVDGQPPASFTFTDVLGVSYTCSDPDGDLNYACTSG